MGRKGVSKRKPKKDRPFSTGSIGGSSNTRSGEHSTVASLVKDTGAPLINRSGANSSAGSNKKRNKGN
jgi:hypothetical protein